MMSGSSTPASWTLVVELSSPGASKLPGAWPVAGTGARVAPSEPPPSETTGDADCGAVGGNGRPIGGVTGSRDRRACVFA